jgi:RNA polymerase sigma-70 factor (ECF subfamily)
MSPHVALTAVARPRYFLRLMSTGLIGVTDADLARAIAARSDPADAAESELYRRFSPRVRLYGLRHLRDEDAARDLVQQVLLLTIEKLRKGAVRDMDMIGSFVLGVCRLHAVNMKRRDRRREALLAAFPPGQTAVTAASPVIDEQELEGCLSTLSERERTVVLLTFYGDRSSRDIAQTLGISEGNVRVIRSRAVDRLRACMRAAERPS